MWYINFFDKDGCLYEDTVFADDIVKAVEKAVIILDYYRKEEPDRDWDFGSIVKEN